MRYRIEVLMLGLLLLVNSAAWAAHPLITDDTGTQGKGKFLVEISAQYDSDKETANGVSTESTGGQAATTLSYGFVENADLELPLSLQRR